MADIKLNIPDGRNRFIINGDENRAFYTNLSDTEIAYRAENFVNSVKSYIEDLEKKAESGEMTDIEFRHAVDEEVKKQIDYIFDASASKVVFGNLSIFAEGNRKTGETLFELFWAAMFPQLEKEMKAAAQRMADSDKRIAKYTAKYRKKK